MLWSHMATKMTQLQIRTQHEVIPALIEETRLRQNKEKRKTIDFITHLKVFHILFLLFQYSRFYYTDTDFKYISGRKF